MRGLRPRDQLHPTIADEGAGFREIKNEVDKDMNYQRLYQVWIYLLTFSAGVVNAIAFLEYSSVATHQTGNLTQLGLQIANGDLSLIAFHGGLVVAYVTGATIAGSVFPHQQFRPLHRYGLFIALLSLFLLVNLVLLPQSLMVLILALIVGALNGMFIFFRGSVVRTTHMMGVLTDLGQVISRFIKGSDQVSLGHVIFLLINIGMYLMGVALGAKLNQQLNFNVLYGVVAFNLLIAAYYEAMYHLFPVEQDQLNQSSNYQDTFR